VAENVESKDCAHEVWDGSEGSMENWASGHSFLCHLLWQRNLLHFVHALRLCGRLSLKVID
jgi:hypothetical protein